MTGRRRLRLDQLLVERGLVESRARGQALLLAGKVRVGDGDAARVDRKAGEVVDAETPLAVEEPLPYVSRGGVKLRGALDDLQVDPAGLACLDVGASTGGFTDLLLQRGAARVYALDVGRGQLAERLRGDPRVVSLERTNARSLGPGVLPEPVALSVVDVSFISLERVLGPVAGCSGPEGGRIVALVKPQFEAGRGGAPGGVVRDPAVHLAVLRRVAVHALGLGLDLLGATVSPLRGPQGNREFFLLLAVPAGWRLPAQAGPGPLPVAWEERLAELAAP